MPNRLTLVIGAVVAAISLGLYLLAYAPLMRRLKIQGSECRIVEGEVNEARNLIAIFRARETDKTLILEKDVSATLEELTRQGNFIGINFISVTPRSIEEGTEHRILPIEMELESSYETLGKFLGLLDDMQGNLLKVRDFMVNPKSDDPHNLMTRLTVSLYLAERSHAG